MALPADSSPDGAALQNQNPPAGSAEISSPTPKTPVRQTWLNHGMSARFTPDGARRQLHSAGPDSDADADADEHPQDQDADPNRTPHSSFGIGRYPPIMEQSSPTFEHSNPSTPSLRLDTSFSNSPLLNSDLNPFNSSVSSFESPLSASSRRFKPAPLSHSPEPFQRVTSPQMDPFRYRSHSSAFGRTSPLSAAPSRKTSSSSLPLASPRRFPTPPPIGLVRSASSPISRDFSPASIARFNEAFPPGPRGGQAQSDMPVSHTPPTRYSPYSVPTTPTSARSRSPSMSSLETIPDTPDAEAEALRVEKEEEDEIRRRERDSPSLDLSSRTQYRRDGRGLTRSQRFTSDSGSRAGSSLGRKKRWSVCGGEWWQETELPPILED